MSETLTAPAGPLPSRLDQPSTPPRIRDAATLILLDRSAPEPLVLLGRRHAGHVFMPGKFVFPGGRVEPGDAAAPALGALDARAEAALAQRVPHPAPDLGRALALAAIRETFEETGLMLGRRVQAPRPCPEGAWAAFAAQGVVPDLGALQFVARAITPPARPKRFDTRFFIADRGAVAHEVAGAVGPDTELVELVWAPIGRAAALDLPLITRMVLADLATRLAAEPGIDLPIPFHYEQDGQRRRDLL